MLKLNMTERVASTEQNPHSEELANEAKSMLYELGLPVTNESVERVIKVIQTNLESIKNAQIADPEEPVRVIIRAPFNDQ